MTARSSLVYFVPTFTHASSWVWGEIQLSRSRLQLLKLRPSLSTKSNTSASTAFEPLAILTSGCVALFLVVLLTIAAFDYCDSHWPTSIFSSWKRTQQASWTIWVHWPPTDTQSNRGGGTTRISIKIKVSLTRKDHSPFFELVWYSHFSRFGCGHVLMPVIEVSLSLPLHPHLPLPSPNIRHRTQLETEPPIPPNPTRSPWLEDWWFRFFLCPMTSMFT